MALDLEKKRETWRRYYRNTYANRPADHPTKIKKRASYKAWAEGSKAKLAGYQRSYKSKHWLRRLTAAAVRRSAERGMECDAEYLSEFQTMQFDECQCCAAKFVIGNANGNQAHERAPTLDRIDSKKGYVRGNVGVLCWRCNRLKSDAEVSELHNLLYYMMLGA